MDHRGARADIADRVQAARQQAGLTLEGLADRTGIPYRTLRRRTEVAPGRFTLDELEAIATATEASFEDLVAGAPKAAA